MQYLYHAYDFRTAAIRISNSKKGHSVGEVFVNVRFSKVRLGLVDLLQFVFHVTLI